MTISQMDAETKRNTYIISAMGTISESMPKVRVRICDFGMSGENGPT